MPKLFKIGRYIVYFWSNEDGEPIHVHIGIKKPSENATKIWLTRSGGCIVAHNNSRIPQSDLYELIEVIRDSFFLICNEWKKHFSIESIIFFV